MPRISYFSTPDLARLPNTARRVLERRAARLGFYPNFFLTFALRPHHLARWAAHYAYRHRIGHAPQSPVRPDWEGAALRRLPALDERAPLG